MNSDVNCRLLVLRGLILSRSLAMGVATGAVKNRRSQARRVASAHTHARSLLLVSAQSVVTCACSVHLVSSLRVWSLERVDTLACPTPSRTKI